MHNSIDTYLRGNKYPGRGIVLGRSEDGERAVVLYFITGRSENTRNRLIEKMPGGIRTIASDPSKLTDPSLVIYNAMRIYKGITIISNGVQTDTIHAFLQNEWEFNAALFEWEFEPDPPIYTPRISGLVSRDGSYCLSILKTAEGDPACCYRHFFNYSSPRPGVGHFISTYKCDGNPPPSYEGEPITVNITTADGLDAFASSVWSALDDDNKVSLYAREIDIATGESLDLIINKYE